MKRITLGLFFIFAIAGTVNGADFFAARKVGVLATTKECVGTTKDPLCVFDTVVACAVRADASICKSVGIIYDDFFRNSFAELVGKDYTYTPVEMYVNRRVAACAYDNDKACALNPYTGKIVNVDMSIKDNNNVAVYLKREPGGNWSVIFATQYACWSDEECS